jgi:hypothetical protein
MFDAPAADPRVRVRRPGTIRWTPFNGTSRKFDARKYIARWEGLGLRGYAVPPGVSRALSWRSCARRIQSINRCAASAGDAP